MIEETGRVVALDSGRIWVEIERVAGCKKCEDGTGCGQGLFAKLSARRYSHVEVECKQPVMIGDSVVISLAEDALVKSCLLSFALPLIMMLTASVVASGLFGFSEPLTVLFGIVGLGFGMGCAYYIGQRLDSADSFHPQLVRVLPSSSSVLHYPN